jgi:hypothetical protein
MMEPGGALDFLAQLVRHSNLSALGEQPATGDEPSKILIILSWGRPCIASGLREADCHFLEG